MPIDKDEYTRRMRAINRAFVALTILFFVILISFMVLLVKVRHNTHRAVLLSRENATLIEANTDRVQQEKRQAIATCKHTYSGIKDVFEIFFVKHPSAREKHDIKKFNDRIKELQLACSKSKTPTNQ